MKNNQKVNIFGIFWHDHKIDILNDKCAKNHLKMRCFDRWTKLLKFVKETKETSDKKIRKWSQGDLNSWPFLHISKLNQLSCARSLSCKCNKWIKYQVWLRFLKNKMAQRPCSSSTTTKIARASLTCSILDEIKRCKHVFCSFFNKE